MKCPACGEAKLIHDIRDLPYTYKGESTLIPAVSGEFCAACSESILDSKESDRVMRAMREFALKESVLSNTENLLGAHTTK